MNGPCERTHAFSARCCDRTWPSVEVARKPRQLLTVVDRFAVTSALTTSGAARSIQLCKSGLRVFVCGRHSRLARVRARGASRFDFEAWRSAPPLAGDLAAVDGWPRTAAARMRHA